MAAAERSETEYRERLDRTVQFMNRLNLPPKIQDRVRSWFTYNWSIQKTLGNFIIFTSFVCGLIESKSANDR